MKATFMSFMRSLLILSLLSALTSCAVFREPIKEAARNYSTDMAKVLIDFSILAYEPSADNLKVKLAQRYPNFELLRKVAEDENGYDTQGFVAYDDNKIIIAMRGSSSKQDWMNNFKIIQYNNKASKQYCPNASVHGGFHKSALAVSNLNTDQGSPLIAQIQKLYQEGRDVYFTGHSLGGAIANVLAFFTVYETDIEIAGIYTFGEPRAGNEGYQQCHDAKLQGVTFRFVNDRDAVARLPQSSAYVHVGNLIYFDTYGNIYDKATYNSKFGMIIDNLAGDFAQDHFKESYAELVYKNTGINPFLSVPVAATD